MKCFIVLAHHEPRSFNAAMAGRARALMEEMGHEVRVSDLYAMRFDPVSDRRNFLSVADPEYLKQQAEESHAARVSGFAEDIRAEIEKLEWCDLLILQFPRWWFGMPAILKGWVDRVFAMGRIYGGGRWYDSGVFAGKRAMVSLTTGGPEARFRPGGLNPGIAEILKPIEHGVLWFTGFSVLPAFIVWGAARIDDEARGRELARFGAHLRDVVGLPGAAPPRVGDFPLPKGGGRA